MSNDLQVRTTERDGAAVVTPRGDVDLSCSPVLRDALMEALDGSPRSLIVDMQGVGSIDSSGLATLIESMRETQARGIPLVLCAATTRVRAVFEIARLDSVFTLVDDVDAAMDAGTP